MKQPTVKSVKVEPAKGTAPQPAADDSVDSVIAPEGEGNGTISRPQAVMQRPALRLNGKVQHSVIDPVAEETPVALVYNGISHAVMMATPADLEDFALGFSLSEGILTKSTELYDIEVRETSAGLVVELEIATSRFVRLRERRRSLAGRTGCGLCGIDSLDEAVRRVTPVSSDVRVPLAALHRALAELPSWQALNRNAGSLHAAAWANQEGAIAAVREDVGRHNALDKLIGAMAKSGTDTAQGFALLSSRLSYELVQKAAAAGMPLVVAISAPTALALDMAETYGITTIAHARANSLMVYTHPERLIE